MIQSPEQAKIIRINPAMPRMYISPNKLAHLEIKPDPKKGFPII